MKNLIIISITDGDVYYNLLYLMASIVSFTIFLFTGLRRKYPLHDWLLICFSGLVCAMIGMHIATFSIMDWNTFLTGENIQYANGKTSIGGLAGLISGIWIAQKTIKSHYPVLDIYAYTIPIVLIIQRLGCLLAGCCYGVTTEGFPGIRYANHFPVYMHQLNSGILDINYTSSLPVHPVPLYFMGSSLLMLFLISKFNKYFFHNGSLFLFSIILLGSTRFIIEFFRDPVTNHQLSEMWSGIKIVQWIILVMVIFSLTLLIIREKFRAKHVFTWPQTCITSHISLAGILALLVIPFIPILGKVEVMVLLIHFVIFVLFTIIYMVRFKDVFRLKYSPLLIAFMAIIFMGQTDTIVNLNEEALSINPDAYTISTQKIHTLGGAIGNHNGYKKTFSGSGCDRTPSGLIENTAKSSMGYTYEYSRIRKSGKVMKTGVGFTISPFTERKYDLNNIKTSETSSEDYGIVAYFGRDWKNFGYRLGGWGGNLHYYSEDQQSSNFQEIKFIPVMQLRIGPLNKFYLKAGMGDDFQYGLYRYMFKASAGGSVKLGSSYFRYQIGLDDRQQFSIDTEIPIYNNWSIMPSIYLSDDPIYGIGIRFKTTQSIDK